MFKLKTKYNNYLEQLNHMTDDRGRSFAGQHVLLGISNKSNVVFNRSRHDIKSLLQATTNPKYRKHLNYYMTTNTFKAWNGDGRNATNVLGLCGVWSDIDCKDIWDSKIIWGSRDLSALINVLPHILDLAQLPIPTAVNVTGHGVHIIWLFDYEIVVHSLKVLHRWQPLEDSFNRRIDEAGLKLLPHSRSGHIADYRAEDVSRVLRVPNTWNVKQEPIKLCQTIKYTGFSYDFDNLCANYIEQPDIYNYFGWTDDNLNKTFGKQLSYNIKRLHSQRRYRLTNIFQRTLYTRRIKDLKNLVKLRNNEGILTGYREQSLFLYAVCLVQLGYTKIEMNIKIPMFSMMFKKQLSENQVEYVIHQAKSGKLDKYNKMSNSYYIRSLNITLDEQKSLKFLVSRPEQRRRHNLSRNKKNRLHSRKFGAKYKRMNLIHTVKQLYKKGLSIRNIAKKLNISKSSVSRYSKGD